MQKVLERSNEKIYNVHWTRIWHIKKAHLLVGGGKRRKRGKGRIQKQHVQLTIPQKVTREKRFWRSLKM